VEAKRVAGVVEYLLLRVDNLKKKNEALGAQVAQSRVENERLQARIAENSKLGDENEALTEKMKNMDIQGVNPAVEQRGFSTPQDEGKIAKLEKENQLLRQSISKLEENRDHPEVSECILDASKTISAAFLKPPGSRPCLELRARTLINAIKSPNNRPANCEKIGVHLDENPKLLEMRALITRDIFGFTPLLIAADAGRADACTVLLTRGANINATDLLGRTALHIAASKTHLEAVRVLLEYMGDATGEQAPQDISGITPAAYSAMSDVLNPAFSKKGDRKGSLHLLHRDGDVCISPHVRKARIKPRKSTARKARLCREMVIEQNECPADTAISDNMKLLYGSATLPGYRVAMEDAVAIGTGLGPRKNISLFAVFDGHGGRGAAEFCSGAICDLLNNSPQVSKGCADTKQTEMSSALQDIVLQLDEMMMQDSKFILREVVITKGMGAEGKDVTEKRAHDKSGTTLTMVAVTPTFFVVANVGDSRTILIENNDVIFETRDHTKPSSPEGDKFWANEVARIVSAGGEVDERGRVSYAEGKGSLAMTRALGDFDFKQSGSRDEWGVVADAETYAFDRSTTDPQYLVLACDGVWDVDSNNDCKDKIWTRIQGQVNVERNKLHQEAYDEICEDVARSCLHSEDNISLLLVALQPIKTRTEGVERNLMSALDEVSFSPNTGFTSTEQPGAQTRPIDAESTTARVNFDMPPVDSSGSSVQSLNQGSFQQNPAVAGNDFYQAPTSYDQSSLQQRPAGSVFDQVSSPYDQASFQQASAGDVFDHSSSFQQNSAENAFDQPASSFDQASFQQSPAGNAFDQPSQSSFQQGAAGNAFDQPSLSYDQSSSQQTSVGGSFDQPSYGHSSFQQVSMYDQAPSFEQNSVESAFDQPQSSSYDQSSSYSNTQPTASSTFDQPSYGAPMFGGTDEAATFGAPVPSASSTFDMPSSLGNEFVEEEILDNRGEDLNQVQKSMLDDL